MLARHSRSQDGFTLVELLVAVTINGALLGAIAGACFVGMSATTETRRGLGQSNAEQVIGHWLIADVHSACEPALDAPVCPRSPNPSPATSSACGATVVFALDSLSSLTASAADTTIGYALENGTLTRLSCAYGASAPNASVVMANNVSSAVASYPSTGTCGGRFQFAVTIAGSGVGPNLGRENYIITTCAQPRAS
jgi:prepilin-type N-terminal cleavage/methylation domain-containing protein